MLEPNTLGKNVSMLTEIYYAIADSFFLNLQKPSKKNIFNPSFFSRKSRQSAKRLAPCDHP